MLQSLRESFIYVVQERHGCNVSSQNVNHHPACRSRKHKVALTLSKKFGVKRRELAVNPQKSLKWSVVDEELPTQGSVLSASEISYRTCELAFVQIICFDVFIPEW